jgi:hypothetical protein
MSTPTPPVPSNLEAVYASRRQAGADHDEASRAALHAFGGGRRPSELDDRLQAARAEFESDQLDDPVEPAPEALPPHPLDAVAAEVEVRIRDLTEARQKLSLDSLTDEKAGAQLASTEKALADAQAELGHVALARKEASRREQEEAASEQRKVVADALQRAGELQHLRQQAAERVDKAALQFARALADHQAVAANQVQALTEAGRAEAFRTAMPPAFAIAAGLAHALFEGGAPAGWIELDRLAVTKHAPLAALDIRAVDPITPPKSNRK